MVLLRLCGRLRRKDPRIVWTVVVVLEETRETALGGSNANNYSAPGNLTPQGRLRPLNCNVLGGEQCMKQAITTESLV